MNRRNKAPQRSFGTNLSANSPLPPRHTPKKHAASAAASKFVDDSVGAAVGLISTNGSSRQNLKQMKSATIIDARSVEKTAEQGQLNSALKSRFSSNGEGEKTPVAKLLAFSETPVDSFKIYTGTPDSEKSPSSSPSVDAKRWSYRAVTAGAHRTEGSFLYSSLGATSPSFEISGKKSWAQAVAETASPQPKNLLSAYPTQQLRRPVYDADMRNASPGSTASIKSPDSTASVAPTPIKHSYNALQPNLNIASPTGSIISTSTVHTSVSTLFAQHNSSMQDVASNMGPLEYAIQFPPGPLPLELEGVIESGNGKSIGCCVVRIKQGVDLSTFPFIVSSQATDAQVSIQPNDLLISLNSISILSRPHSTIISLLQQFVDHPKTIVFRSLDKVWKSQFQPRTMRNVRSGKRVNTAMDVESMERELWSWVETPTKVMDDRVEEAVRRRMARKSGLEKVAENVDVDAVLSTPMKKTPVQIFSPSNVKKISRATPTPLKSRDPNRVHDASTTKKNNRKKSETPGKKQLQQIGQVLVGSDTENQGFERILKLKKEVLNELHSVRLALIEETECVDDATNENMSREMLLQRLREETAKSSELEKRLSDESTTIKMMQQKLYQAYEAMQTSTKDHETKLIKKEEEFSKVQSTLEAQLSEKQEECITLQSKRETELAELRAELSLASVRTLEREQKSIIMQTDLEEERSKTQAIQSMLEETQRSKAQQEKLVSSLEEEADNNRRRIKEAEDASDLKSEELHRLRKIIEDLESKNKAQSKAMQSEKWSEREKMVEQQRVEFEKRETSLESQLVSCKAQLNDIQNVHNGAIQQLRVVKSSLAAKESAFDSMQAENSRRIRDLEIEREDAFNKLDEAKCEFAKREAALIGGSEELKSTISDLTTELERQSAAKMDQDALVKKLQEEVQIHLDTKAETEALIDNLNAEIRLLNEAVQEQGVVKSILAENLSKHIAAAEDGLIKLGELSCAVEGRLDDFSTRIAASEAGCRAAVISLNHTSTEKDSSLQRAASNTAELESKVVQVAAELEKCLLREQGERAKVADKKEALEKALKACEELRTEKDELSAMFESLESDSSLRIKELEGHCAEKDDAIKSLESDCVSAANEIEAVKASHFAVLQERESLELRVADLTTKLEVLSATNEQLKNQVDGSAHIQDQLESKEDECRRLIEKIQSLELEASENRLLCEDRETRLQQSHEELSKLNEDVAATKAELAKAKQHADELKSSLTGDISSMQQYIAELNESKAQLQQDLTSAESKCNDTSIRLKSVLISLQEKEDKLAFLVSELDDMHSSAADLALQVQTIKHEKEDLQLSRASETKSLQDQLTKRDSHIHELQSELHTANDKMQSMSVEHQKALDTLASRIETTQCEASVSVAQFKANLETAERLLDQGDQECERLESEMNDLNVLLKNNQAELDRLNSERDVLLTRLAHEEKQSSDKIDILTNKLRLSEEINSKLKAENNDLSEAVLCMKQSLADANSSQSDAQSSLSQLMADLHEKEAVIKQSKVLNDALSASVEDLTIQLNQSKRDIRVLEKIKKELTDELSLLESTKKVLSNQLNHLEAQSKNEGDIFKVERQELMRSLDSKTAQISALSSQKEDLMATVETLQNISRSADLRVASLTVEKEKLADQIQRLKYEFDDRAAAFDNKLVETKEQMEKPLQSKEEEVMMLNTEIQRLRNKTDELKQTYESNEDSLRRQLLQSLEAREQDASESTALQLELESKIDEQADVILAKDKELLSMKSLKVKLEQIIDGHKSHIKELEKQIMSDKQAFDSSLQESIKAKEACVSELTFKFDELQKLSQSEKDTLTLKNDELEGVIKSLRMDIDSLKTANEAKLDKIKLLNERQIEMSNALDAAELQLNDERERMTSQQSEFNESIRAKETEIKQINENAKIERQLLESKLSSTEVTEKSLKSTIKDLEQNVCHLKSQALQDSTNLKNSIAAEKIKYQHLKENLETARSALSVKESQLQSLMVEKESVVIEAATARAELQTKINELQCTVDAEKAANADLSSRLNSFASSLKMKEEEIELLKAMGKSSSQLESQLIESKQSLFKQQQSSLETEAMLTAKVESLLNEIEVLRSNERELSNVVEGNRRLEEENHAISCEYKDAVGQLAAVQLELQSCKANLESEKASHREDLTNNDELRSKLQEAMSWCDSLRAVIRAKETLVEEVTSQRDLLRAEITQKDELLREKERRMRSDLEGAIGCSDSLRSEIERQKVILSEKDEKIKSLTIEMDSVKSLHQATILQLNADHQAASELFQAEAQRELSIVKSNHAAEKKAHEADLTKMDDLRQKLQEAIQWSDSLRSNLDEKQVLLREKEHEVAAISEKMELLQTSASATVAELSANHHSSLEAVQRDVVNLRSELVLCQDELATSKRTNQKDYMKISNLTATIDEKNGEIKSLEDRLQSVKTSSQEALEKIENDLAAVSHSKDCETKKLKEKCNSLSTAIAEKEKHISQHQCTIASMTRELEKFAIDFATTTGSKNIEIQEPTTHQADLERSLDNAMQQLQATKENLVNQQVRLNEALTEKESVISSLSDANYALEDTTEKLRVEIARLERDTEQEIRSLGSKLSKMQDAELKLKTSTETLQNNHQKALDENEALVLELKKALHESHFLSVKVQDQDKTIASLRSMLHRCHLDVCQLSMELSCTKGSTVLCIADVKKGLESLVNDIAHYYQAKEVNYQSIINELKEVVSKSHARKEMGAEKSTEVLSGLMAELDHKSIILSEQSQLIKRLTFDLDVVRDELTSVRAEVGCSKEIESSLYAERVLLHQAISTILNSHSNGVDIDDSVFSSTHPHERFLRFVEHEMRDLCILHNSVILESDDNASQLERINTLLQSLKFSAVNDRQDQNDLNQTSDSQKIREIVTDIELAKTKVINMSDGREEVKRLLSMEQERSSSLEQVVADMSYQLDSKSKLLSQAEDKYSKLQTKFDHTSIEIDECHTLAHELKKKIIEKNAEIQSKQNQVFELQYKLDDLTSRIEDTDVLASNNVVTSSMRHNELAEEVARLEEQILRMNQDASSLSSMHQALVEGLESECQKLTDELDEARGYICELEDVQTRLEGHVDVLARDCEAKARINLDLESAINILQEQKARAESDNRHITSEVSKLTLAVISCAPFVEGFSSDVISPSSWYENLQYIGRFIHFLHSTHEAASIAEVITPLTKGKGGFCERTDVNVGFKEIHNTLKNVLASPRLTPVKEHTNKQIEQDDLYFDLVNAVGQLERLSDNFRVCQEQWKDKELHLISLIKDLEVKSHAQISNLELEQAWRRRLTSTVIESLERRRHCSVLRRAFQTWACQARLRKHLNIVKDMAKELLQTRQKVLLLKSHFADTAS